MKIRTAPLDPQIADRLLQLLSTDDIFRERFQRDHMAALQSIGYEPPTASLMTACGAAVPTAAPEPFADCRVRKLASKEIIASARAEIKTMLLSGLAQETPKLDATLSPLRARLK